MSSIQAKQKVRRITIVGAGNVGHNFGKAFRLAGYLIHEIYSRTKHSAMLLSQTLNCDYTTRLNELKKDTDLIILAVNDDAIPSVLDQIQLKNVPIVHTSGSTPMDIFDEFGFKSYGIFYPVQSFSKNETESLMQIPICVEGKDEKMQNLLLSLARTVSSKVYSLDSEHRRVLHISAVFANNFTNHLFHIADEMLGKYNISFEVIRPLIEKTAEKLKYATPFQAQTGPAVRNDRKVIDAHLDFLEKEPEYREMYALLTKSITNSREED